MGDGVMDVSSLGRVYSLDLSCCENVSDVSALGNVHILKLNHCARVLDVSSLSNVRELQLEGFKGYSLLGLENVEILFLSDSAFISDISPLTKVKELFVEQCFQISHFHDLQEVQTLGIGFQTNTPKPFRISSGMELFSRIVVLQAASVEFIEQDQFFTDPPTFLSLHQFVNLRSLVLEKCAFVRFPESLIHLQSLKLWNCHGFTLVPPLPSLNHLELRDCQELARVQITGGPGILYPILFMNIRYCEKLLLLTVSRKISRLSIFHCSLLSHLRVKAQINYLNVAGCLELKNISCTAPIICQDFRLEEEEVKEGYLFFADEDEFREF
jgi:hypothetical protein